MDRSRHFAHKPTWSHQHSYGACTPVSVPLTSTPCKPTEPECVRQPIERVSSRPTTPRDGKRFCHRICERFDIIRRWTCYRPCKKCALMCACAGLCLRLFARVQLQLWTSVSKNRHQMPWHHFENKFLLLLFAFSHPLSPSPGPLSPSLSLTHSIISGYIYIVGPKNTWAGRFSRSFCFSAALHFILSIAWNRLVNVFALVNGRHIVLSRISG